ncbi:MAG: hypothetical protein MZW92_27865 [Comamonadaceae bacterium]|nr:hypothetical protein [Comamonadaceae bacterium]
MTSLAATGRISRASLRALRDEIDHARRVALTALQVSRLASGRVPVNHERLDLTALGARVGAPARAREIHARGVELRQHLASSRGAQRRHAGASAAAGDAGLELRARRASMIDLQARRFRAGRRGRSCGPGSATAWPTSW